MKTLENHQILFDAECPMCKLYTKAIVDAGILDKNGRMAYQEITELACPVLDRQRAVNEIALVNNETGQVTYGIHSLFKVVAVALPRLSFLFTFRPFVWLMAKLYAFISYNRRIIIPPKINSDRFQLQPTFRPEYRIAYIVFTGYVISEYVKLLVRIVPQGGPYREYIICIGQIIFQGFLVVMVNKEKLWTYLGNMMTVSFAGGLVLLPIIWLSSLIPINPMIGLLWFLAVVGLMLLEHLRRCRLLGLGWILTASWILYRMVILVFIELEVI